MDAPWPRPTWTRAGEGTTATGTCASSSTSSKAWIRARRWSRSCRSWAASAPAGSLSSKGCWSTRYHDRVAAEIVPAFVELPVPRTGDLDAFTDGWLRNRRLSDHTREAYRRDVGSWLDWCRQRGLDPLTATFVHVNAYARELESTSEG